MDIIQLVVVVMVVTIIATITLAAASYAAFRMRERRSPAAQFLHADGPVFFERVRFLPADSTSNG